jgi:protein-tyrosine phosphatase
MLSAPTMPIPPGHVPLEGPLNFRDLGGAATADGRTVRHGVVYRADDLNTLTGSDLAVLGGLGVKTVIDLRTSGEVSASTLSYRTIGIAHHHLPVIKELWSHDMVDEADLEQDLAHRYVQMVELGAPALARAVSMMADRSYGPTVFHCAAGKDRTGILAALVERLLGVDDAVILERYAASGPVMDHLVARWTKDLPASPNQAPAHFRAAPPRTLQTFLGIVDERFGGAEQLLVDSGMLAVDVQVLRDRLLE